MLVARDGQVTVEPLGKVLATDCAWVDLKGWDPDALKNVCEQLRISAELPAGWEREPTRAAFASRGDLLALVVFTPEGENLRAVALMTGPNWMITMHAEAVPAVESVWQDALQNSPGILQSPRHGLYEVLESVADRYLELIDRYEDEFDQLEDAILEGKNRAREVFAMRRRMHDTRRILADQRRAAARMARRGSGSGAGDASLLDVYDAFYHVMDNVDGLRDNLTGLVDLQLNQHSTRLNEVMKFLTIFSTIFLPLSFLTGFLGMNLRDMSELGWPHVQPLTIAVMMTVAASMLMFFKRKGWF